VTVRFHEAAEHPAAVARSAPGRIALTMAGSGETRTYGELDEAARRLSGAFRRAGLKRGDHLAVMLDNRPEFFETVWAGFRMGLYVTPVNWHLSAAEAAFIISDCGANALVAGAELMTDAQLGTAGELVLGSGLATDGDALPGAAGLAELGDRAALRLSVGGEVPGYTRYETALADTNRADTHPADTNPSDPDPNDADPNTALDGIDECEGQWMFYSSGTTGRPKGIVPGPVGAELGTPSGFTMLLKGLFGFSEDSVYLSPAPLYHAAPAGWTTSTQRLGGSVVVMERFDPLALLAAVERHRVTHLQVVPTHLVRLLKLPEADRARFDLSSLEMVVHAAAPCPVSVKQAALDWLGPIIHEYYAGSEGNGFCAINSQEWLDHPGSVGRSLQGAIHIVDADGTEAATGVDGEVWFESPRRFEYHGDPAKTAAAWNDAGWSTIGDIGHVDADGYLYLTDRASNMIISGGVNIYPRAIEDVLIGHAAVLDVAVIGTPHEDLGEQVTAYVQVDPSYAPDPGPTGANSTGPNSTGDLISELDSLCHSHLGSFECPKVFHLVDDLPRQPTGKLVKRLLRTPPA